jgi:hypothetical protein
MLSLGSNVPAGRELSYQDPIVTIIMVRGPATVALPDGAHRGAAKCRCRLSFFELVSQGTGQTDCARSASVPVTLLRASD